MSLFKKPKRNIRLRECENNGEEVDDNEVKIDVDSQGSKLNRNKPPKKSVPPKIQSTLSFFEELDEGDDGEVFQVKKTSQSKKFKKLLDKEKRKKKDDPTDTSDPKVELCDITPNEITIKIKNSFPLNHILNGREAEAAMREGISSDEDENSVRHKFSHPEHVKMLLKSGTIPDAIMIHEARKRRQKARETGSDFISVNTKDTKSEVKVGQSRLARDDENDVSDDDEKRIVMTVNTDAADKERRREAFQAAQVAESEESDRGEEEEWEKQQIRKGVTGAQLAAAQQENLYYQYMPPELSVPPTIAMVPIVPMEAQTVNQAEVLFPPLPTVLGSAKVDPETITCKLKERLASLKEVARRHSLDKDALRQESVSLLSDCDRLKEESPTLGERFRFYQDLRGYVTDLVECLDEKVVILVALEQRLLSLYQKRAGELIARRRQDVRDQAEEMSTTASKISRKRDEESVRRAAEREGRRIRRMRAREMASARAATSKHVDGMSSDDEITEMESAAFRSQRDVIENDARHIFEDALDEFATVSGVLERFEAWKRTDLEAYEEAYVSICLPKVLGPLIRLNVLMWNPLIQGGSDLLDKAPWRTYVLLYSAHETETEASLRLDPDVQLLPKVIEKIILPKLDQIAQASWDPMSTSQTTILVSLVTRLVQEYPTLGAHSKILKLLINNIVDKMKEAVDNDVFIPIYPRQVSEARSTNAFFNRQFAAAVKLLGNLLRWQGLLHDSVLSQVAIDALLNRYLLMALRTLQPTDAASKAIHIASVLPRVWLYTGNSPPQLAPLFNQALLIAQQLDASRPLERDTLERMGGLLKTVL